MSPKRPAVSDCSARGGSGQPPHSRLVESLNLVDATPHTHHLPRHISVTTCVRVDVDVSVVGHVGPQDLVGHFVLGTFLTNAAPTCEAFSPCQVDRSPGIGKWLVEQRFRAVLEVLDGSPVTEVAVRYGVSRQAVCNLEGQTCLRRRGCAAGGVEPNPRNSPARIAADVEAQVCEMRRAHPRWGARRIAFELAETGVPAPPSRATVHRILVRYGLVHHHQEQQQRRKCKRRQREVPMHFVAAGPGRWHLPGRQEGVQDAHRNR